MNMNEYSFSSMDGVCDECGCELWFGQSEAPHADLCDDCYDMEIINGECSIPKDHPTHKQRQLYQNKRYAIRDDKIEMRCEVEVYQERKFESLTEIRIGE